MIDHVFLTVSDLSRSIDFYTRALAPPGSTNASTTTAPSKGDRPG